MSQARTKVLTVHVKNLRLTPELAELLAAVAASYKSPTLHTTQDGLVVTVESYSRGLSR